MDGNGQNGDFSTISVHATVPSLGAEVYYDDQNTNGAVTCTAYAVSSTGSIYWSREAHSELASVGKGTLRLAQAGGWGGSLGQATMDVAIRGLAYECGVPGTVDFKPSAILGYQTIICANNSQCVGGI